MAEEYNNDLALLDNNYNKYIGMSMWIIDRQ